ncbi:hypothetical protein C8J56DRAFT_796605, partial [Mycena floridula]
WGETLFNFYHFIQGTYYGSRATSSIIAAWMEQHGETYAARDLELAKAEDIPRIIEPCDVETLIKDSGNFRIMFAKTFLNAEKVKFPFHASNYPRGPFVPFSDLSTKLQKHIPHHLLPEKLIIHDPYKILTIHESEEADDDDGNSVEESGDPETLYTYHLSLTDEAQTAIQKERRTIMTAYEEKLKNRPSTLLFCAAKIGHGPPALQVPAPPPPPPVLQIPEAHMYISPTHFAGEGNHSFAYNVELELPRSIFLEQEICPKCVFKDIGNMVTAEGKAFWTKFESHIVRRAVDCEMVMPGFEDAEPGTRPVVEIYPAIEKTRQTYKGPARFYDVPVHWQDPYNAVGGPCCEHLEQKRAHVPMTHKFKVVAKLSKEGDHHLEREAKNYQAFPDHFFRHYSGYNIMKAINAPFPIGPLVPQFYGYYKPEPSEKYMSPVLLIEDCGVPIIVDDLNIDQKTECASLFLRFHHAGWVHNSADARNIMVQTGALQDFPMFKKPQDKSFRLIDFGRSLDEESSYKGDGCVNPQRFDEQVRVLHRFNLTFL